MVSAAHRLQYIQRRAARRRALAAAVARRPLLPARSPSPELPTTPQATSIAASNAMSSSPRRSLLSLLRRAPLLPARSPSPEVPTTPQATSIAISDAVFSSPSSSSESPSSSSEGLPSPQVNDPPCLRCLRRLRDYPDHRCLRRAVGGACKYCKDHNRGLSGCRSVSLHCVWSDYMLIYLGGSPGLRPLGAQCCPSRARVCVEACGQ